MHARILSIPAVQYQLAMVNNHPEIKNAVERILLYVETEAIIDNVFQEELIRRPSSINRKTRMDIKRKRVMDSLKNKQ